jgi:hypothetical protein
LRSVCVGRLFGFQMAATVILRCFHANFINCAASLGALRNYALARVKQRPLTWDKTAHSYPAPIEPRISESGD